MAGEVCRGTDSAIFSHTHSRQCEIAESSPAASASCRSEHHGAATFPRPAWFNDGVGRPSGE